VRWWIESYVDTRRVVDRVHTVLQHALDAAGIESPYPTQNLNLQVDPDGAERLAQASGRSEGAANAEAE
jgi:small-conductance mechanosensitive channel